MCICRLVIEGCFNKTVYHKISHILVHLTGYHSMLKTDAKVLIQSRAFELVSRKPHLQSKPRARREPKVEQKPKAGQKRKAAAMLA